MRQICLNLVSLCLLAATALPAGAYSFAVDGIYYGVSSGTAYVTYRDASYNSYSGDIVIPATVTYSGTTYNVTAVGAYAFMSSTGLKSVVIGDNVTSIGRQAFYQCDSLAEVTTNSALTSLAEYAFGESPMIAQITLPEGVTTLGAGIFYHCYGLEKANLPSTVTSMSTHTFNSCYLLDSIFIPDAITTVYGYTFYGCSNLKTVTIGNQTTTIDGCAFQGCSSLAQIDLPSTLESIKTYAFDGCESLSSIEFPSSLTSIATYAFRGTGLVSVEVPSTVTTFSSGVFKNCSKLETATLGDDITSVPTYTFDSCAVLKNVTLAPKTTTISSYAFRACASLESIELPSTLSSIGSSAFRDCSSLKEIDIPVDVPKVTSYVFRDCSSLEKVTLNSADTELSAYAFQYDDAIRTIYCKTSDAPTCSTSAFKGTTVTDSATLYVPLGAKDTYAAATGWSDFVNIVEMDFSGTATTYWISGDCNSWSTADSDDYAFTNNGDGTHSLSLNGFTGEFKIVTSAGAEAYGYGSINLDTQYALSASAGNISISGYQTDSIDATFDLAVSGDTIYLTVSATEVITLNGEGTAASPYLISSADEWNALARYMKINNDSLSGKYVQITADISFSGSTIQPLGYNRKVAFNGDLDGNGKTISGIDATADDETFGGLIVATGTQALIHDLTVEGAIATAYYYTGGVVGELNGTISNVTADVDITAQAGYAAAMVGHSGENAAITGCTNLGDVTSSSVYPAGVVARAEQGLTVTDCTNKGNVTYTGYATASYAAGIVSYATNYCTITGCANEGLITASNDQYSGYTAGILAYATLKSGSNSESNPYVYTITDCHNSGDITSGFYNGGVVCSGSTYARFMMDGCYNTAAITSAYESNKSSTYTAGVIAGYGFNSTYRNCYNSGKITSAGSSYSGGVAGNCLYSGQPDGPITISNCYNTGKIAGEGNYAGGIAAHISSYTTIDSCYNTADINSDYTFGGIVGSMTSTSAKVTNSWNSGNMSGKQCVGGIVGSTVLKSTISNCYNLGDISAATQRGGGIAGDAASEFINVYNAGDVTGGYYIGGLVGMTDAGKTTIANSYSSGTVSASTYLGNIVGTGTADTLYWGDGNSIENVYYLSGNAVTGGTTDPYSTPLTYAELAAIEIDGFNNGDAYTYPLVATIEADDYAKVCAAAIVPADGDTYSYITTDFCVGLPDGAEWTASRPTYVTIDGNTVKFVKTYSGYLTMTITCGEASKQTKLTCYVKEINDGVTGVETDSRQIVSEKFFTTGGMEVANPTNGTYIVVRTYDDGTTQATKEARK